MISKFSGTEGRSGYIALISVIIIALLLITISVVISFGGFLSRFSILDNEYKEVSSGLAEACANTAILKIAENWSYTSSLPETVTWGANNCQIISVQDSGSQKVIHAQANYQKSYTNLEIKVSNPVVDGLQTIKIDSWGELANLP